MLNVSYEVCAIILTIVVRRTIDCSVVEYKLFRVGFTNLDYFLRGNHIGY